MKHKDNRSRIGMMIPFAAMFALGILSGCDTSLNAMDTSASQAQGGAAGQLTRVLELDADQVDALAPSLEKLEGREPGALWGVATELQNILTPDQKQRLLERAERPSAQRGIRPGRGGRGMRPDSVGMQGGRGPHGGMRGSTEVAGRRANREAMGQTMRGAMVDALGLTAEQQEQLKALHESQRQQMEAMREAMPADSTRRATFAALRDSHRAAMESILTEAQRETIAIHRALLAGAREPNGRGSRRANR